MADKTDYATYCAKFISQIGEGMEMFAQTEYSTPEEFRYNSYLVRLGSSEGFGLPSAQLKAEVNAVLKQSYERKGRLENANVAMATQRHNDPMQIIESGVRGYLPITQEPTKQKRSWWRR
jgi:hypothetical protein